MYIHNKVSKILQIFRNKLKRGDLVSPFLLCGGLGSGRFFSIINLIRDVECENYNPFEVLESVYKEECECIICKKIEENNSEDILVLNGGESLRDFQESVFDFVEHRSVELSKKYLILRNLEMYSSNTLNTFLKILEEPYPDLVIVVTAGEVKYVPKAILSRLKRFRCSYDLNLLEGVEIEPYKKIMGEWDFRNLVELQLYSKYSFKKKSEEIYGSNICDVVEIIKKYLKKVEKDKIRKELILGLFLRYYVDFLKEKNENLEGLNVILKNYDKSLFKYLGSSINYFYMNIENQILSFFLALYLLKEIENESS